MRLNYGRTLLIGFAFFGLQVLFGVYNAYVPILLQSGRPDFGQAQPIAGGYGLSATFTGFIMTLDNLAAIIILPVIGALSDVTRSRWGKRKPYILLGAPLTAAAFAAIPFALGQPLWVFMLVVIAMILAADLFRTPAVALMPDLTPSPLRSQANGIINLMGGIGATLAFLVGGALADIQISYPFLFGAAMLFAATLLVLFFVPVPADQRAVPAHAREQGSSLQRVRSAMRAQEGGNILDDIGAVARDREPSTRCLLLAIFFWFLAYSALTVFFTSFAVVTLGLSRGQAALLLAFFSLTIVVCALPAGLVGARVGRRRAIMIGLAVFAVALGIVGVLINLLLIRVFLVMAGAGWSLVVVNSLPMVLDSAPMDRVGAYTGLYYLGSQTAEVVGPLLVGALLDLFGRNYRLVSGFSMVVVIIALVFMRQVRRGEAQPTNADRALDQRDVRSHA